MKTGVVVGIDGSARSSVALRWAISRTDIFGPVTPLLSYSVQPLGYGIGPADVHHEMAQLMKENAEAELSAAMADVMTDHPEVAKRARTVAGHSGANLVEAAAGHALLVVGTRGRGAVADVVLGSTASYCVTHSHTPVAVIPGRASTGGGLDEVVVGVDGSANAVRAMKWALANTSSGGRVAAVGCWAPSIPNRTLPLDREAEAEVTDRVARTVAEAIAEVDGTGPTVESRVERGDPRLVLQSLASDADLLVLGTRGHRGLSYLLLGSTATSILHNPTCPTVVVPESCLP